MLRRILRLPGLYPVLAFLLARRVLVRGWSMYPTLAPGEYVLFDRLAYRLGRPQRGDVVLASHPARSRERIIKRVVGLPGERIALRDGRCWVNGEPLGQPLGEGAFPEGEWTLGDDQYFLLGDAPDLSTDARHFGPVQRQQILARAWLVYWPPQRMRAVAGKRPSL
jgi:signal peptidase I